MQRGLLGQEGERNQGRQQTLFQGFMKFEDNIRTVMTGGPEGRAQPSGQIFRVLGRLHRFLCRAVM